MSDLNNSFRRRATKRATKKRPMTFATPNVVDTAGTRTKAVQFASKAGKGSTPSAPGSYKTGAQLGVSPRRLGPQTPDSQTRHPSSAVSSRRATSGSRTGSKRSSKAATPAGTPGPAFATPSPVTASSILPAKGTTPRSGPSRATKPRQSQTKPQSSSKTGSVSKAKQRATSTSAAKNHTKLKPTPTSSRKQRAQPSIQSQSAAPSTAVKRKASAAASKAASTPTAKRRKPNDGAEDDPEYTAEATTLRLYNIAGKARPAQTACDLDVVINCMEDIVRAELRHVHSSSTKGLLKDFRDDARITLVDLIELTTQARLVQKQIRACHTNIRKSRKELLELNRDFASASSKCAHLKHEYDRRERTREVVEATHKLFCGLETTIAMTTAASSSLQSSSSQASANSVAIANCSARARSVAATLQSGPSLSRVNAVLRQAALDMSDTLAV